MVELRHLQLTPAKTLHELIHRTDIERLDIDKMQERVQEQETKPVPDECRAQ